MNEITTIAGLELAKELMAMTQEREIVSGRLSKAADCEDAIAAVTGAAAELQRLEAERDELRAELAQAREVLRALDHTEGRCPLCGWRGHAPDCKLSAALAAII